MDRFSTLPVEVTEIIMSKFDYPEINVPKLVSKHFNELITSKPFSVVYDNRPEGSASSWLIAYVFSANHPDYGTLVCVRLSDSLERNVILRRYLRNVAKPNGRVTLLAADGSLVLLRYTDPNQAITLFVINIGTPEVHGIDVPQYMDDFRLYVPDANFKIEPRVDIDNISYKITGAEFGNGNIVRHFSFISADEEFDVGLARSLEDHVAILPDIDDGIIRVMHESVLLVSKNLDEFVYKCPPVAEFVHPAFEYARSMFTDEDMLVSHNWAPGITNYYSTDGWAVMMLRRRDHHDVELSRVRKICLFQVSEDWTSYQHVSTTTDDVIDTEIFYLRGNCFVQQVGEIVNFTLVTQHVADDIDEVAYIFFDPDDDDVEAGINWRLIRYSFNTTNGNWTCTSTPIWDATEVRSVVYTFRFTLGHLA